MLTADFIWFTQKTHLAFDPPEEQRLQVKPLHANPMQLAANGNLLNISGESQSLYGMAAAAQPAQQRQRLHAAVAASGHCAEQPGAAADQLASCPAGGRKACPAEKEE